MVRRLTMLLLVLMFLVVGAAYGQSTFWVGSVYNDDVGAKVPNVMNFDWASSGSGNAQGGASLALGQTFTFRYQSYLFALNNTAGQVVNFPGLNTSFEYTAVAEIPMMVVAYDAASGSYIFKTLQGGRFYMYHDSQRNAVVASGYGFDDGDLVVSGMVDADQFVSLVFTSPTQAIGSTILNGRVLSVDAAYLDPAPSIVSFRFESTVNFPPLDSTTATYFAGRAGQGNLTTYSVTGSDLALKVDASTKFMVEALRPEISVAKVCADAPAYGQPITFSAKVKNTGTEPLTNITCVDTPTADLIGVPSSLDPGQEVTVTGSYMPTSIPSTDTLTCSGTGATTGTAVSSSSSATCTVNLMTDLTVEKQCVDAPQPGAAIVFMATLTNSGNEPLINVSCTDDPNVPLTGVPIATLAPGATATVSGSYVPTSSGSTDTITCSGTGILSQTVVTKSSGATCNIITHPCISVTKNCVDAGGPDQPITFTGTVTNCGDVTLEEIFVVDDHAGPVLSLASLAPGASVSYSGSYVPATSPATNTVTATGSDAINGGSYSTQASATCSVACTGEIGNFVWFDANANGIQDAGENGIAGATVNIYDSTGTTLIPGQPTIITPASGAYLFSGLCQGTYVVKVVPPVGYAASPSFQGGDATKDSNGSPATVILPADNSSDLTIDFGYYVPAAIGDYVWNDANKNGVQDGGEMGISGVTVKLYNCATNALVAMTTTGTDGSYSFTGLMPGSYRVEFVAPMGYAFTMPNQGADDAKDSDASASGVTDCYTLVAGETNNTVDAGLYVMPAAIGDYVWNDANKNGVQDGGEMGISGVTVKLYNCATNALVAMTTTGTDGSYSFTGLMPGSYRVEFVAPMGYAFTMPNQGADDAKDSDASASGVTDCYTLVAGETNNTIDAGLYVMPAAIGDYVWNDANKNGVQDGGEMGISGVTVKLYNCTTNTLVAMTTTGTDGSYSFTGLMPGSYRVEFVAPMGYAFTMPNQGADDAKDSDASASGVTDCYTLVAGETNNTIDAGLYVMPASIGDKVWNDLDKDGQQDGNEPGIPNVTVNLYDCTTNTLVASTTTDVNGLYGFTGLMPGSYRVEFVAPMGYSFTLPNVGNDATDSDANASGVTGCYDIVAGQTNLTIDAGLYKPMPSIDIEKFTNGDDADTPTGPKVLVGSTVTWTYVVTNTGNVELTGVVVTDDKLGAISCSKTALAPMESMTCTKTGTAVMGQYANMGTVTGQYNGTTVTDQDPSHYYGVKASIDIEKYTNGDDADLPTGPKIPVGGMVEWKYVVTNTGNQELINVTVTDDKLGVISCPKTVLAPMESMTCIETGIAVMGQYANMGTVTGQYNGTTVTDQDPSHYFGIPACVPCQDGVTWMQLKLDFHQYPSYSPYDRIRVRADGLTGEILYDSKYDSVSTTGLPVGAIFSFNVPPSAKTVVVTVQGKYHTYETVKATFSAECDLLIGTISGNTYIKFKVMDAKFDGELSCTPKTPDIDVEKYVSNDGGKTWHDADDAPGLSVPLCSQAPPPPPEPTCGECSGGITELTLLYKGSKSVKVVVKDSKGNQLFSNTVYPNKTFTVKGTNYSGTMGSYIKIYIGSTVNTTIYTDCSKSIYPGMTSGSFSVVSGASKNGGELCDKTSTSSSTSYSTSSSTTTSWWWSSSSYSSYTKDDDDDDRNSYEGSDYDKAYSDSCGTIPVYPSCNVQFKFVVKNTGNTDLTNIILTDDVYNLSGKCTIPASLAPGASFSCTIGPFAAEAGQHTNTATVTGKYNGFEVSDSDKANYYGGKPATGCVRSPGYWKTHPEAWPVQTIVIGGVTYSKAEAIILMEKPVAGDKTFTLFPALVSAKLNVLSGADAACISDVIASADNWMATYPIGSGVTGSSSAWDTGEPLYLKLDKYNNGYLCASYCGDQNPPPTSYPKISIDKYTNGYDADMAPGPYIWIGDQVKWTYVIKNTGNTTLSGITVSDDKVSSISCPKSSLMSGESMTCTATGIAVKGQYENTGCVVGYASGNVKVSDCDLSHYYGKEKQTQSSCGTGTPGYWKNHPEAWPVSSITIGGTSYSKDQAISIMAKSVSGDKTYTMFPALVSAKLNVMVGNNSSCISSTITAADAWMKTYKLGSGVTGSSSAWKQGEPYYWALDNYNNGLLCAPHRDSASSSCSSSVPSEWFN